jgi:hypothetical protein
VLDRLLTLDRGANIVMLFKIDELLQVILLRETEYKTVAMFIAAPDEVAGDADVKRTIAAVSHYVNKAATHHTNLSSLASSKTWMAGTSPAMTNGGLYARP